MDVEILPDLHGLHLPQLAQPVPVGLDIPQFTPELSQETERREHQVLPARSNADFSILLYG
mgnify:CR=1 FL=1